MKIEVTPEITLSPLTMSDATSIFLLVNQNREELENYFPWVKSVENREGAEAYIADRIYSEKPGAYLFSVAFRGQKSGVFGIKSIDRERQMAELGYWLSKEVRGRAITNTIITSLSQFLAKAKAVKTIEFRCLENNSAGRRVIEKTGATLVDSVENDMDTEDGSQAIQVFHLQLT